jgi:hypothetical protein
MQRRLHVCRTPFSPALIRCEAPRRRFFLSVLLPSCRLAPLLSSHASSSAVDRAVPQRLESPSSCATSTSSTFQPHDDHLVVEAETPKRCYRGCAAAAAESLRDASPHRSSSDHTCTIPSTARALDAFPPQDPPPATAGHPLRADPLRPTAHRRRATATMSLPPPFASNRGHHRPGPLTGYFPTDQRRPAGRIRPVSHRRQGGISLPCVLGWAETPRKTGPFSRAGRGPTMG